MRNIIEWSLFAAVFIWLLSAKPFLAIGMLVCVVVYKIAG